MRLHPLAAAAVFAAFAAHAEDPAPPVAPMPVSVKEATQNTHLTAAIRLYQKVDLDAALAELSQAEAAAKDNEDDTVRVLVYRGLIFSETGRPADANDQFKRALAIRPWAEVPEGTSPRIAKVFADARKSIWGMGTVKPPQRRSAGIVVVPAAQAAPEKK
jgi:tetratricopeptide (TPR) repeat protein